MKPHKCGPKNPSVWYRYVFAEVIEHYVEAKFTSGHCSQFHYGNTQHRPRNAPFIRPSASDFVCDCEIAMKAVLTPTEIVLFCNKYLRGDPRPIPERIERHIEETLGAEFIARHIHPVNEYFRLKLIIRS